MTGRPELYGLMGRFPDAGRLVTAAGQCREDFPGLEAYSPFPMPELSRALALGPDRVSRWALAGAVFGAVSGFLVQYWTAVVDYPIDVGGRPLFSWPAFLPIVILLTLFWGSAATALGMFVLDRLPRLYHPVFNAPGFDEASRNGFFLVIRADEPAFDGVRIRARLRDLGAESVEEIAQ